MDNAKAHLLRLLDVYERIVDEETLMGRFANPIEQDLKDLRARLHMTHLARDDIVIEQVEEVMFLTGEGKGLSRPVAQTIKGIPSLLQFLHDFHGTVKRMTERIDPVVVIRLNEV